MRIINLVENEEGVPDCEAAHGPFRFRQQIGGFHLMKRSEFSEADTAEVAESANCIKSYKTHFTTCHCTGLSVFNQKKEIMGSQLSYVRCGDEVKM